ncbi:MAG: hypothetical protein AAF664_12220 [Planctomycetota bacterium]
MARLRVLPPLLLLLALHLSARGHDLPDGEIERRVQISVKPSRILVEYSLEMSEVTLRKELMDRGLRPSENSTEMWAQFKTVALTSLPKGMSLVIDGETVQLSPLSASYSGWSHRKLSCLLAAEIELSRKKKRVSITDRNFSDTPGHYRMALKSRSGAQIENSTKPLLISKMEPVVLSTLEEPQKLDATTAQADFFID